MRVRSASRSSPRASRFVVESRTPAKAASSPSLFNSLKALRFTAECDASCGPEKAKTFEFIAILLLKDRVRFFLFSPLARLGPSQAKLHHRKAWTGTLLRLRSSPASSSLRHRAP